MLQMNNDGTAFLKNTFARNKCEVPNDGELQYLNMMRYIEEYGLPFEPPIEEGKEPEMTAISIAGYTLRFDPKFGFPLLTSKFMPKNFALVEMLWIFKGLTNVEYLHKYKVHYWDEWANKDGDVGQIYGAMMRRYPHYRGGYLDQLNLVIQNMLKRPLARSTLIDMWRPDTFTDENGKPLIAIKPCHHWFQIVPNGSRKDPNTIYITGLLQQRSCDVFLGVPFNIAGYFFFTALLTYYLNTVSTKYKYIMNGFTWQGADVHLYVPHLGQVDVQLNNIVHTSPELIIKPQEKREHIWDFEPEDFEIIDYQHSGKLPAPISLQGNPKQGVSTLKY